MSMENGKSSKGLIILLILIVLCLVGYIVYTSLDNGKVVDGNKATNNLVNKSNEDNVVVDNSKNSGEVNNNQVNNNSQDEPNYVKHLRDRCSYGMYPYLESILTVSMEYNKENQSEYFDFTKYNAKDSDLIKSFLSFYLSHNSIGDSYMSKETLDNIVKIAFNSDGLSDYAIYHKGDKWYGVYDIIKIDDNNYKYSHPASGYNSPLMYNTNISYDGDTIYIVTDAYHSMSGNYIGKVKFTVKMGDQMSCHISNVENVE